MFEENAEYEAFVDKFKPKKTTDDCYTPPSIYAIVRDWACREYGIDREAIVRPFYPGGDYERFEYPEGCVVLDNPPFSILTQIIGFYQDRGIPFFLFAPTLTCLNILARHAVSCLMCGAKIIYENGAVVPTSFVTNIGGDVAAQSVPELTRLIDEESARLRAETVKELPAYRYPDEVVTAAALQYLSRHGVDFAIRRDEASFIRAMDAQRPCRKSVFGGGLLLSPGAARRKAAAEKAAAEKAAAEKAAAEKAAAEKKSAHVWRLSPREEAICQALGRGEAVDAIAGRRADELAGQMDLFEG